MHAAETLQSIYEEHRCCIPRMVDTLMDLDIPAEDALLLGKMPWELPANRIAVERERLGMLPVLPLLRFKLPPPPPAWLTPAVIVKIFELALDGPGGPPPGATSEDYEDDESTDETLVLPA